MNLFNFNSMASVLEFARVVGKEGFYHAVNGGRIDLADMDIIREAQQFTKDKLWPSDVQSLAESFLLLD